MTAKIPKSGLSWNEIQVTLNNAQRSSTNWKKGRLAGMVYYAREDILKIAMDAYTMFFSENIVIPEAFPGLTDLETQVIDMTIKLLGRTPASRGIMTSGGTESILIAVKTARESARENKRINGIPEMVTARSAHPAFNKAAHLLNLKVKRLPLAQDFRADVQAMKNAITNNTIMLVGSAPGYPHGRIDPITELGELAQSQNL